MNRPNAFHAIALLFFVALLVTACASSESAGAQPQATEDGSASMTGDASDENSRYEGRLHAPLFPADLDWINTSRALTWEDVRGKVVLLDFWTYGCINCIHMIPVLEQLQEKYANELVVIGVHSAKFENEGSTENIRQIAGRYGRSEPIVNDWQFRVWSSWGARAWPTIALVDPRGNVVAFDSGEIPFDVLDPFIAGIIDRFDELGLMDRSPVNFLEAPGPDMDSLLLYPGKVLADPEGGRLFIADSNHNRIVVTELSSGNVVAVIGSGEPALIDGDYAAAAFAKPQGLALSGDTLYVADLDNHAIRAVDLAGRSVSTVAGTGVRGTTSLAPGQAITEPRQTELRSPWAIELVDDTTLFIAMAGTHQIWQYNIDDGTMMVAVGNGRESLLNDTLATSELAQPSGLYHVDGKLYFADSESSTIRVADLRDDTVATVSGPLENSLFVFGDTDGVVGESRLQHPLGVTGAPDGTIYFADTYNSRIKAVDPETLETTSIFGLGGSGGYRDGNAAVAEFDEPGGLDYAAGRLYVADTNNHAVRIITLSTGVVDTLQLRDISSMVSGKAGENPSVSDGREVTLVADNLPAGLTISLEQQHLRAGNGDIEIRLALPDGYKLNPLIQSTYELQVLPETGRATSDSEVISVEQTLLSGPVDNLSFSLPAEFGAGSAEVRLRLTIYYCETELEQLCILDHSELLLPILVADEGSASIRVNREIEAPELQTFGDF